MPMYLPKSPRWRTGPHLCYGRVCKHSLWSHSSSAGLCNRRTNYNFCLQKGLWKMEIYANITHCHVNLRTGSVKPKAFRSKQRKKIKSFGPRQHPVAQVVTRRPQIITGTGQGEQSAKAASPQVSGRTAGEKSWQSRSLSCQVLVTAVSPLQPHEHKGHPNTIT